MIRCIKCGKGFDEEMYCHICPKCGTYNRPKEKYNVNQYYSSFDEDTAGKRYDQELWKNLTIEAKVSTQKQAEKLHEELHKKYEHRSAEKAHEKHSSETKRKKPKVLLVCISIVVLVIAMTAVYCQFQLLQATQTAAVLDFESDTAKLGEICEVEGRGVCVKEIKLVDTSGLAGIPEGEKLVAVFVDIDNRGMGWQADSNTVYLFDGTAYMEPVDSYGMRAFLPTLGLKSDNMLNTYSYLARDTQEGYFLFLVSQEAQKVEFTMEEQQMKNHVLVITKQIAVNGTIEEQ